jgi:hypothetical protein
MNILTVQLTAMEVRWKCDVACGEGSSVSHDWPRQRSPHLLQKEILR